MPSGIRHNTSSSKGRRLVVAGGGTGGHLFPGIAIAQAFLARHDGNRVLFINAGRPLEIKILSQLEWQFIVIPIEGIKGRSLWRQLGAGLKIPLAIRLSVRALKEFSPHAVMGVGGYSAGPVVAAAWWLGILTVLHEQNQLPGITNRILGRMVRRVYLSFEDEARRFKTEKVLVSGNPVRNEILALADRRQVARNTGQFTVLVVGGSQGAHAINAAMTEALPRLKALSGLYVVHQTGSKDESLVRRAYENSGIKAEVKAFFNDMAEQYMRTDLIVCRAGATTVAEITVVGKAAIFIPFPHAADDHQTRNAQALVAAGAAEMIDQKELDGETLAETILKYAHNPSGLVQMAANARSLGRPEAALTIVDDLYGLLESKHTVESRQET